MPFSPNYNHVLDVLNNKKPARLPIYEHIISAEIMEKILGIEFSEALEGDNADCNYYFQNYCSFWKQMTYDTISYENCVVMSLPQHGAIFGGKGPIQNRQDYDRYPWEELADIFWHDNSTKFSTFAAYIPKGMKAVGGIGNGPFEISEDLVGFESLAYLQSDDPELLSSIYDQIGDLLVTLWTRFLDRYADSFAICRIGDDLGFKTSTLISPRSIRQYVIPQYKRVIQVIQKYNKPFLWHSCGKIFSIMDEMIELGINAKHSNEDQIAPYEEWINRYNDRIGLLGGIDVNTLCLNSPQEVFQQVFEKGSQFRNMAKGYALGSGNSIPEYVPVENYLAMVEAAQAIRAKEM